MIVFRWRRVTEESGGAIEKKDRWNSEADRRGRRGIKISWDFVASATEAGSVREVHRWEEMFLARVESNKFSHIPGETRLSPPSSLSLSLRSFDKGSTFKLLRGENKVRSSRVEISNKFDRCKTCLLITCNDRLIYVSLDLRFLFARLPWLRDKLQTFFFSPSTIKRPTPSIVQEQSPDKSNHRFGQLKKRREGGRGTSKIEITRWGPTNYRWKRSDRCVD